jgi:hypothetical protein
MFPRWEQWGSKHGFLVWKCRAPSPLRKCRTLLLPALLLPASSPSANSDSTKKYELKNRLHDWPGRLWQGRYHAIRISDEEEAQVARLRYVLGAGVTYGWVVAAHRAASARLRGGDRHAAFPEGTFPPSLPFVAFAHGPPG